MARQNENVDGYMQQLEHPHKPAVEALRTIIKSAGQEVTEHIKWNAPSYVYRGDDRITFRLQPGDRIQLIFHRGAKVKPGRDMTFTDESGMVEWAASDRGLVTFHDIEDVYARQAALEGLVRRWLEACAID